mmetsp:Transcript_14171/g.41572  ORF Transcript_14171/g.41572 Transcript_14171/m.41572 type:complete len:202 (+) Transcript_14171:258-863(+)
MFAERNDRILSYGTLDAILQHRLRLALLPLLGLELVEEEERRQSHDVQPRRHLRLLVGVELAHANLTLQVLRRRFKFGGHQKARTAPSSVSIDDQGLIPLRKHQFEFFSSHQRGSLFLGGTQQGGEPPPIARHERPPPRRQRRRKGRGQWTESERRCNDSNKSEYGHGPVHCAYLQKAGRKSTPAVLTSPRFFRARHPNFV